MSKSLLSVVVVPAWALLHVVPVPWQLRTVLPAVTTWPRSVVLKRGAKVRSAEADGASTPATTSTPTRSPAIRRAPRAEPSLQCCRERWTNLVFCGPSPRHATRRSGASPCQTPESPRVGGLSAWVGAPRTREG